MHEFSLAQSLMRQLEELADTHRANSVKRVTISVGSRSGIVADSFEFGFEVLAKDRSLTRDALLDIIIIEPDLHCRSCGFLKNNTPSLSSCPACNSPDTILTGGDELILTQVEME